MSFLLWQRGGDMALASPRRVLRAHEVPLLQDAQALRARIQALHDEQAQRVAAAEQLGHAEGLAQGLAEGRQAAQDELAARLQALAEDSHRQHEALRQQVVPLALQVVHKLLGGFAPDAVLAALARTALDDLLPSPGLTLWVHPEQLDAVRTRLMHGPAEAPWPGELRADPNCAPDTCRLETDHGSVDASLSTQLEQLQRLAAARPA
ncbi:type III secretion apparatus protein, HrpE/YscL family [Burkholderiales bacterium JOSHI_001]|nr:type III secretion apparatus protein, HrpE/YscL family [Burkholderiales bacterium JOSHI_001]